MALASQTMPTSATVSTAKSVADAGSSVASLAYVDASEASSMAVVASTGASIADSIADAAILDASEASSMAVLLESKAVLSEPASGEYPVKEMIMNTTLDMVVTYDDSSIA